MSLLKTSNKDVGKVNINLYFWGCGHNLGPRKDGLCIQKNNKLKPLNYISSMV